MSAQNHTASRYVRAAQREAMHRDIAPMASEIARLAAVHGYSPDTIAKHALLIVKAAQ
jgi:hypothetical protein